MVNIPLLSFVYVRPVDGLPLLHQWILVLKDIVFNGFESWREPFEGKLADESMAWGSPLGFGAIQPVKGLGRLSILLWCIFKTYTNRAIMTDEAKASFGRWTT